MRTSILLIVSFVLSFAFSDTHNKRPLDLPVPGIGANETEEDAPESILFYGIEYEGDTFYWVLDKSGSMSGTLGLLIILKQQVCQSIDQLSTQVWFSMNAFSSNLVIWGPLQQARLQVKNNGKAWVNSLVASGSTCIGLGIIEALEEMNSSERPNKRIIVVSDGVPGCTGIVSAEYIEEVLADTAAANYQLIPIDTLFLGSSPTGSVFMQLLAAENGGTFTLISP